MSQRVDIGALSLPELQELAQQLSAEVNAFASNMVALQQTAARFAAAGQAVEALGAQAPGAPLLLPLTESLYVAAELESVDTVLLEVGTGYFVERDAAGGADFCRRKVLLVRDKVEQLAGMANQRQAALRQVGAMLEAREREAAAAGGAPALGA